VHNPSELAYIALHSCNGRTQIQALALEPFVRLLQA